MFDLEGPPNPTPGAGSAVVRHLGFRIQECLYPVRFRLPTEAHPSIPPYSVLPGRQAQGFHIGVRCPVHIPQPPTVTRPPPTADDHPMTSFSGDSVIRLRAIA